MPAVAVFRNNVALLPWMFTSAWVSMVSVLTWLILDSATGQVPER